VAGLSTLLSLLQYLLNQDKDQTSFFIRTINEKHSQFRDVLHPIIIAIYQVKHGLRIAAEAANQIKEIRDLNSSISTVAEPHKFIMVCFESSIVVIKTNHLIGFNSFSNMLSNTSTKRRIGVPLYHRKDFVRHRECIA
jgi:hypothetical protein